MHGGEQAAALAQARCLSRRIILFADDFVELFLGDFASRDASLQFCQDARAAGERDFCPDFRICNYSKRQKLLYLDRQIGAVRLYWRMVLIHLLEWRSDWAA